MTEAAPLVHLVEPGAPRVEPALARLAERFRVVVLDARESAAALVRALDSAGLGAFNLLATGGASRAVAALARETGPRLLALALESPAAPGAHLMYVYNAGPAIGDDRPDAFADVVGDFFERHDAFVISRATTVIHP